jgi:hypothetical protein
MQSDRKTRRMEGEKQKGEEEWKTVKQEREKIILG